MKKQFNRFQLKSWSLGIGVLFLFLSAFNIFHGNSSAEIQKAHATNPTRSVNFRIRCRPQNTLRSQAEYQVVTRLENSETGGSSIALIPSSGGKVINQRAVSEGVRKHMGKDHYVAIFEGPELRHSVSCIGRDVETGTLLGTLKSGADNPPFLMSSGNSSDINNFIKVPTNGEKIKVAKGVKSGQGVSRFEYGTGTQNPFSIAIAYPSYQHGGSQSYTYNIGLSSTPD